jgi:hypothetical protein
MRTYEQQINYERLELISRPEPKLEQQPSVVMSLLKGIGQKVIGFFAVDTEPKIWQITEPTGEIWWRAYDPVSGRSAWLATEEDVLKWVEDRYYQRR